MAITTLTRLNRKRCDATSAFQLFRVANHVWGAKQKNASSHAVANAGGNATGRVEESVKSRSCQTVAVAVGVATTLTGVGVGLLDAVTCTIAGVRVQPGPAGATVQVNVAVPEKVVEGVKLTRYIAGWPGPTVAVVGPDGVTLNRLLALPVSATVGLPPFDVTITVAVRCPTACG